MIILTVMDWRYCWQCAEALALSLVRLAPFGLLVALVPQAAGDDLYHKNRRLSAVLRVVVRIVITPALLVLYVVLAYAAYGVWSALLVPGCSAQYSRCSALELCLGTAPAEGTGFDLR